MLFCLIRDNWITAFYLVDTSLPAAQVLQLAFHQLLLKFLVYTSFGYAQGPYPLQMYRLAIKGILC
jgi:hypothetical protein